MIRYGRESADSILQSIRENGGFNNFRHWNNDQKTTWVMSNYNCTKNMARKVAKNI